jgi:polar amino acid transport system permease protein
MYLNWLTEDIIHLLGRGLALTVILTVATSFLSVVIGVGAGTMRMSRNRTLRLLATLHVDVHRNLPALVLLIFWAYAFPQLFSPELRRWLFFDNTFINWLIDLSGFHIPYYPLAAIFALSVNTSAYIAEQFRAGVGTIAREQMDAARSLGATQRVIFFKIMAPQGIRAAFPAMSTRLIHNMKNTSLAAIVSVPEFYHAIEGAINRSFRVFELLLLAGVIYLVLATLFASILHGIERYLHWRPVKNYSLPQNLEAAEPMPALSGGSDPLR